MDIECITLSSDDEEIQTIRHIKRNENTRPSPGNNSSHGRQTVSLLPEVSIPSTTNAAKNGIIFLPGRSSPKDSKTQPDKCNTENSIKIEDRKSFVKTNYTSDKQTNNEIETRTKRRITPLTKQREASPKEKKKQNKEKEKRSHTKFPVKKAVHHTPEKGESSCSSSDDEWGGKDLSQKVLMKLKKLMNMYRKVQKRIEIIEKSEVSSDEEEENSYMQLDRYRKRALAIYNKMCEITNKPPDAQRLVLRKISYPGIPAFPVLSRALEKHYNKKKKFPDFLDIKRLITRVNEKENLGYTVQEIPKIAEELFVDFGSSLQRLRKWDDYGIIIEYLQDSENDPALTDDELNNKLNENKLKHHGKEKAIIDEFARKQNERKATSPGNCNDIEGEGMNADSTASNDESKSDSDDSDEEDSNKESDSTISDKKPESSSDDKDQKSKVESGSAEPPPLKKIKLDNNESIKSSGNVKDDPHDSEKENYMAKLGLSEGVSKTIIPSIHHNGESVNKVICGEVTNNCEKKNLETVKNVKRSEIKVENTGNKFVNYKDLKPEEIITLDLEVTASGAESESEDEEIKIISVTLPSPKQIATPQVVTIPEPKVESKKVINHPFDLDMKNTRIFKRFTGNSVVCTEVITID